MRILVAADSFKDALPAPAVCSAIAAGLKQRDHEISVTEFPLADGGEGTGAILSQHLNLDMLNVETVDALGRPIHAQLGMSRDKAVAVVELAQASGLQLLSKNERNPLHTSTAGTGRLIAAALNYGAREIVLSIGGSATTDAGIGIATALGWRFVDQQNRDVTPIGGRMLDIRRIIPPATRLAIPVNVLCDVNIPLFGAAGAAHVFAKQKGASDADIDILDAGLRHVAALMQAVVKEHDLSDVSPEIAGAGAAGGVGYGAMVFLNATLHRGIDYLLDITQFDAALENADLVITGEGKLDTQTLSGKVIRGVCERAERRGVPVVALCGQLSASDEELHSIGLQAAYCINAESREDALPRTAERLTYTAARIPLCGG